jgi:pyridoxal phosphate enzyme (YggS family)
VSGENQSAFSERLERIENEIAGACKRAGRLRDDVQLMAVSKMHPSSVIREAFAAGIRLFGENRVQEFAQKSTELSDLISAEHGASGSAPAFHLIGHLQSNKSAKAVDLFTAIDSVDSLRLAERLQEAAQASGRKLPILLEIKLSHEETKTGLDPCSQELQELLERMPSMHSLDLRGLMTVPPYDEDAEYARPFFRQLRELRESLAQAHPRLHLKELSMGMSGDFAVAIEEGSTVIRLGTALFGERNYAR